MDNSLIIGKLLNAHYIELAFNLFATRFSYPKEKKTHQACVIGQLFLILFSFFQSLICLIIYFWFTYE